MGVEVNLYNWLSLTTTLIKIRKHRLSGAFLFLKE